MPSKSVFRSPSNLSFVVASLCTLLVSSGCKPQEEVEPEKPRVTDPAAQPKLRGTRVEVAVVAPSKRGLTLRVPGEVEGIRDAMLAAPMGGYIEQVAVKEGQEVRHGQVMARVDSQTHSTRLVRAKLEKEAAERELARAEQLGDVLPAAELDAARDRMSNADAALKELQLNVTRSVVVAPFSGVVVQVDAEVGEVAVAGQPMFRLVKLDPVRVSIALSDRDIALAEVGQPARVELAARTGIFEGKVVQISQAANLKTRSFEALVEVDNKKRELLPGMIAQVSLSSKTTDGEEEGESKEGEAGEGGRLLISQDWLVTKPSGVGVFVVENGKAVWRDVELGTVVRRQVEVKSGLGTGDELIIVGHRSLVDGDPVLVHRRGRCCDKGRAVFSD